jgi:YbgC/YbaW family acyl-CoA thioester hydrolase
MDPNEFRELYLYDQSNYSQNFFMNKNPSSLYTVRFGDCDPFGHLNNARYLDYFINAREDHLKESYQLHISDFAEQGISWLVGRHEISYLRPASYSEVVFIGSSCK